MSATKALLGAAIVLLLTAGGGIFLVIHWRDQRAEIPFDSDLWMKSADAVLDGDRSPRWRMRKGLPARLLGKTTEEVGELLGWAGPKDATLWEYRMHGGDFGNPSGVDLRVRFHEGRVSDVVIWSD